jgi:hypothetical protein
MPTVLRVNVGPFARAITFGEPVQRLWAQLASAVRVV